METTSKVMWHLRQSSVRRRDFLKVSGGLGLGMGLGGLLSACGGGSSPATSAPAATTAPASTTAAAGGSATATTSAVAAASPAASPASGAVTKLGGSTATSTAKAGQPKSGGTVRIGVSTNLETGDPQKARTGVQTIYANLLSDTLVHFNDKGEVLPNLATKWEATPDGLTFNFTLVTGAKFHDGESFDATAAKFNFDRMLDPNFKAFLRDPVTNVTGTKVVDDQTIQMAIKTPSALLIPNLTWANLCMVSPKAVQSMGDKFADSPVGIGPFKFVKYTPDQQVELARYDGYWAAKPYLDSVVLRIIPEDSTRSLEFDNKGLEINTSVLNSDADRVSKSATVIESARFGFEWLAMNLSMPLFQDKRMRQAFAQAIDKKTILNQVFYGHGDLGVAGIPPATWGFDPSVQAPPYDVKAAGALLDQLGYKMGPNGIRQKDGQPLKVTLRTSTASEITLETQIVQQMLKQVGIDSAINSSEAGAYFEDMRQEKYEVGVWSLGGIGDAHPGEYAGSFASDYYWNPSRHHYQPMDDLIAQLQLASDQTRAKKIASDYQKMMIDQMFTSWLTHRGRLFALQNNVQGAVVTSDTLIDLEKAWLQ